MWTGTPAEFAAKLRELMVKVDESVPLEGMLDSAELFRHAVMSITPKRLSGVRGDSTLDVKIAPVSPLEVLLKGSGPFGLWELPGRGYYRIPKPGNLDSYAVTSYGVFDHVYHPPRKGHHTFKETWDKFQPTVERTVYEKLDRVLNEVF